MEMNKNNSKFCKQCFTVKRFEEFGADNHKPNKMASWCKACKVIKNKEYYEKKRIAKQATNTN